MERDTGGYAFPIAELSQNQATGETTLHQTCSPGMTLRDYFAGKAMHAEMVTCGVPGQAVDALVVAAHKLQIEPIDLMAQNAYGMADAMLRARKI